MDVNQLVLQSGTIVSRETYEKLRLFVDMVTSEAKKQNLVATSTLDDIWSRHILDSLQLLNFGNGGPWLDLGTGAGFPGLVIAICGIGEVILVEERRLRCEFLQHATDILQLTNVRVLGEKVERLPQIKADMISARAFASLEKTFSLSHRFATNKTRWILPKGRRAHDELESARITWHGDFRLEPSVTDPTSLIVIAENLSPKDRR